MSHHRMIMDTDDAFERSLLASARDDRPPAGAAERAVSALLVAAAATGVAIATSSVASTGAASTAATAVAGSTPLGGSGWAAAGTFKWLTLGSLLGAAFTYGAVKLSGGGEPPAPPPVAVAAAPVSASPLTSSPQAATTQAPRADPPDSVADPVEAPVAAAVEGEPAAPQDRPVQPTQPSSPTHDTSSALEREVSALDGIRRARAAGDERRAQELLAQYDRQFGQGTLGPEAEVIRIESLAASGARAEARQRAEQFLAAHPSHPHAGRVRTLLAP